MSFLLGDMGGLVVFIHVPKTGGTSILHNRRLDGPYMFDVPKGWEDYPKLAFVREPFSRLESAWKDFRYLRGVSSVYPGNGVSEEFNSFMKNNLPVDEDQVPNPASIAHHIAPMVHPVHGLRHADYVGSFERLQQDLDVFCSRFGRKSFRISHANSSKSFPPVIWEEEIRQLVREYYEEDFRLWDELCESRSIA